MNNLKKLKKDIDKWVITTLKHTYKTNDTSEQEEKTQTFIDKWATIISKSLARWKKMEMKKKHWTIDKWTTTLKQMQHEHLTKHT
jgi:transposase-like protein